MRYSQTIQDSALLLGLGCGNNSDPHHDALPHVQSDPSPTQLSEPDRAALAKAKGREVETLSYNDLSGLLGLSGGKLYAFCFWKLNCDNCDAQIEALEALSARYGENVLQLVYINSDEVAKRDEVNTYIRANGMTGQIYQIGTEEGSTNVQWTTELPSVYLVDNEQNIKMYYQEVMDVNELAALVEPLVLN